MDRQATTLTMSAVWPSEGGRTLAGRYLIGEVVGRGGMSTVYRARDETLHRDVAVKILLPSLAQGDPAHVARFAREARAAAALRHPAVVRIFDTGQDRGTHFIVMEYLAGQSLDRLLADGRALEPDQAAGIASQVADALAAAHAAGILHRDVKPANVMIGPGGGVKVLDFGIARAGQDPTLTLPNFALGTAAYMSPERVTGGAGDERSDIYSLGCLLYAMLTGRPPFVGESTLSVLHQQVHDRPVPPRGMGAQIAAPLEAVVLSMLAKDPAERPQSASEVAGRLSSPGRAGALPATPPPVIYRPDRRRRLLAVLALTAALALALVLATSGGSGTKAPGAHRTARSTITSHRSVTTRHPAARTSVVTRSTATAAPAPPVPAKHADKHVPPGHAPGGPPGHEGKPPKPAKGRHGDGGDGGD